MELHLRIWLSEFICCLSSGDVHLFNALILAAPELREKYTEKWDLISVRAFTLKTKTVPVLDKNIWTYPYVALWSVGVVTRSYSSSLSCLTFVGAAEPDESAESSTQPSDLQQRSESSAALRLRGKNQSSAHAERDEGHGHL